MTVPWTRLFSRLVIWRLEDKCIFHFKAPLKNKCTIFMFFRFIWKDLNKNKIKITMSWRPCLDSSIIFFVYIQVCIATEVGSTYSCVHKRSILILVYKFCQRLSDYCCFSFIISYYSLAFINFSSWSVCGYESFLFCMKYFLSITFTSIHIHAT